MKQHFSTHVWAFWYALALLSRVPVPYLQRTDRDVAATSLLYYPVVGALLGLLLLGFTLLCGWWNPQLSLLLLAALLLLLWTGFTGALHLDGLADSADAWVGGLGDRERTLAIMKDPQSGPMGVTAVVLALLLKLAAIFALLEQTRSDSGWNITLLAAGLLLVPMLARASVLGLLATTPYVRSGGMASDLVAGATPLRLVLWGLALAALALLLVPAQGLFLLALWLTLVLLVRQQLLKRLGGCTGDTLGAGIELQEALLLAALAL
ncbi:adenosylcobinamide-GDP ribazoletransferase [Venatoribacter cucullus]|uniref:Adenosylcobinamide-GDP ribazoletransferase n=1 Tax=Venatoribacter cucullus TaxID=2661630 RepID=A0A9X7YNC5_9GAMM|nr:adenosylcobinamide-GDP ribazoletransferase [Venatoribacter cucullus]QQD23521.1 adenosylcobinamide-GDP ribazoletransferase [Venatoribacter cucullus]